MLPGVSNVSGGMLKTQRWSTGAPGLFRKAVMMSVTHGPPAGYAPCAVVGKVMTTLLVRVCAASTPLEGGAMGSKRPLNSSVGTVLVTGVLSVLDRSRTFQAWHRLFTARLLASCPSSSSGRTPG